MVWPVLDIDCCQNYTDSHVQEESSENHVCCDEYINLLNQKGELCTIFSVRHVVTETKGLLVAIPLDNFLQLINSSSRLVIWHDLRSVPCDNFIDGTQVTFDAFYISEDIGYQITLMWIGEKPKCLSFPCLDSKLIRYHENIPCAIDECDKSRVKLILKGKEHLLKIPASHESNQMSPILNISSLRADVIESRKRGNSKEEMYDFAIHIIYSVVEGDPDQWKHMICRDVNVHPPTTYHNIFFDVIIESSGTEWYFCIRNEILLIEILNKDSIPRRKTYKAHVIKLDQHYGVAIVLSNRCSNFAGVDSNQTLPDCSCIKMINRSFFQNFKPNNEKHLEKNIASMESKVGNENVKVHSSVSDIVSNETSDAVRKVISTYVPPKAPSSQSVSESNPKSVKVVTNTPSSNDSYQNVSSESSPDRISAVANNGNLIHAEKIDSSEPKLIDGTVEHYCGMTFDNDSEPNFESDSEDYSENVSKIATDEEDSEGEEFIPITTYKISKVNNIVKMMIEGSSERAKTLIETHSNMIENLMKLNSCDIHHHTGTVVVKKEKDSYGSVYFKSGKIFVGLDKISTNAIKAPSVGVYYCKLTESCNKFKYFALACHTGQKLPYYDSLWKWIEAVPINKLETFIKGTIRKKLAGKKEVIKPATSSIQLDADSPIKVVLSVVKSIVNDSFPVAMKNMKKHNSVQSNLKTCKPHKPCGYSGTLKVVKECYGETYCNGGKIFIPLTCIYPSPEHKKRINFQYYSLKEKHLNFSGFGLFGFTKSKPAYVTEFNNWIEKVSPIELEKIFHDTITRGVARESYKDKQSVGVAKGKNSSIAPVPKTVPLGVQSEKDLDGKQILFPSKKDGDLNSSHRAHIQPKGKIILSKRSGLGLETAWKDKLPITASNFYLYGVCLKNVLLSDVIIAGMEVDYILSHRADGSQCVERVYIGGNDTGQLSPEEVKTLIKEWCLAHMVSDSVIKQIISNIKLKTSSISLKPRKPRHRSHRPIVEIEKQSTSAPKLLVYSD